MIPGFGHKETRKIFRFENVMKEFQETISFIRDYYGTNDFIPLHEPRFRR